MKKIGIIGYNDGNGHPYSFSAIINGYDKDYMSHCPYKTIYNYLQKRNENEFGIGNLRVTHVWTPSEKVSIDISKCTYIDNIVDKYEDMAGQVDAVIIARDDVESHFKIASFFLERGTPVFIDKPLCISFTELDYYKPFLENGLLMSCSGLRYKDEIVTSFDGELDKNDIIYANAFTLLDWNKYGIHVLEGVTPLLGSDIVNVENLNGKNHYIVKVTYSSGKYLLIQLHTDVSIGLKSYIYTSNQEFKVVFDDNFSCFKRMLEGFNTMLITGKSPIPSYETVSIIKSLIRGRNEK
ncbi:Gfo/Idh/MocA family oxidoreductase [Alistipes sp. ZOR0009]|uniref:Gfo/Idh/MocA family oxidoreductase n=1 Tax=Alistipes sp. ZOR0009 TaxID=1339253 RepID=UPI0006455196|nr:Gfo/Idh/MocA family oxidoreductase [Alistipes sp. ZOR0009]